MNFAVGFLAGAFTAFICFLVGAVIGMEHDDHFI